MITSAIHCAIHKRQRTTEFMACPRLIAVCFQATFLFGGSPLGAEQLKDSSCRFCEFAGSHDNRRPLFDQIMRLCPLQRARESAWVPVADSGMSFLPFFSPTLTKAQIDKLLLCSRLPLVGSKLGSHDNYLMYAPLPLAKEQESLPAEYNRDSLSVTGPPASNHATMQV
ncbi:hypothetical protein Pelo_8254 [Pelomyxa schiedti]|nr:hypothetical protein Pelo_8254 [Pelomyxa schiedti]